MTTTDNLLEDAHQDAPAADAEPPARQPRTIQSLERALNLVDILALSRTELPLSELASRAALNISTCHHLLATLVKHRYVGQNPRTRGYHLGNRITELSNVRIKQFNLIEIAMPELKRLNEATRETVLLSALQGHTLVTLAKLNSQMPVGVGSEEYGQSVGAHATGTGKAILAWLPDAEIARTIADAGLPLFTERTIGTLAELIEEFRHVRRNGYAIDDEEFQKGVVGVGAAIRNMTGAVIGAVSCLIPKMRAENDYTARTISDVKNCATAISERLGAVDPTTEDIVS
ncbi:MAG TPA: IclR family transcriptional regulator [Hyphomicrobiales bacterium]|nr:IclR family transcriptional regulator [Hyphomicrobiales bacterium]